MLNIPFYTVRRGAERGIIQNKNDILTLQTGAEREKLKKNHIRTLQRRDMRFCFLSGRQGTSFMY